MTEFNPEGTFTDDSSIFGMPKDRDAKLTLLPAPWEVTTSFRRGTYEGPQALFNASKQMDLYHPYWRKIYERGLCWKKEASQVIEKMNKTASIRALKIIEDLEKGKSPSQDDLQEVNKASNEFNHYVYTECSNIKGPIGLIGGDHSTPYGLIKSLSEQYKGDFSIVHIDAHFDLRNAYQGFQHSHASIMNNVLELEYAPCLFQLGLRDFAESELKMAEEKTTFLLDYEFQNMKLRGKTFEKILDDFFHNLGEKIYISFDIDGLSPQCCPNTGTPVPGGLSFHEMTFLIQYLHRKGHQLVGFDLVEVTPESLKNIGLDEIIGCRLLYELSCFALTSSV